MHVQNFYKTLWVHRCVHMALINLHTATFPPKGKHPVQNLLVLLCMCEHTALAFNRHGKVTKT